MPPQVTFTGKDTDLTAWTGDILAVAVTEKDLSKGPDSKFENAVLRKLDEQLGGLLSEASAEEDFTGKSGQSVVLRLSGQGFKRLGLIGLGQTAPSTALACRAIGESVASLAKSAQAASVAVVLAGIQEEFKLNAAASIASGTAMLLCNFAFLDRIVMDMECIDLMIDWPTHLNCRNRPWIARGQQIQG
jgi:leucyl aminopeptidase